MLIYEKSSTQAPLTLTLYKEGVGGLNGRAPTVAIRDATTTNSYMDFADFTFKTSGWTTKYFVMTGVERGHYTVLLNLSAISDISVGSILSVEYHLDDGTNIGEDQETLLVVETIVEIATDVAAAVGSNALSPAQAAQLKEIWQILGLDAANPLVVTKTHRSVGTDIDQTIQSDVPIPGAVTVTKQ